MLLGEINEGVSNTSSTYLFEPFSFKPLALVQHGHVYHYHTDHIGTPREITNARAEVVWSSTFKTYGALALAHVNEVDNPLRFQGQYYDEETGLHYNRHRYYDPNCGQFTTQDPVGLLGGMNAYQYAPNPLTWVDPWGLSCKDGASDRVANARVRQSKMLKGNVAYNISPVEWDQYPTIGRNGSFVTDRQGISDVIGEFDNLSGISQSQATQLESAFGLEPKSLDGGFKIREVTNIQAMAPRSPLEGNRFFEGPGMHLPGGAPELVIDSIPTIDVPQVKTITQIKIGP